MPVLSEVPMVPWTNVFLLRRPKHLNNTVIDRTRVNGPVTPKFPVRGYELRTGLNIGARLFAEVEGNNFTELAT